MNSPRAWIIHWPDWMGGDSVVFEYPLSGSEITLSLQHRSIEVTPLYAAPSPAVADGWSTYSEAMFAFEKFSSTPDISVNVCDPFTAWSACVDYYERRKPVAPPPAAPQWKCAARAANTGANDPAECNWPMCGCDPYADKVIAALQECGALPDAPAAPLDEQRERERFEAWCKGDLPEVLELTGAYKFNSASMWACWLARARGGREG